MPADRPFLTAQWRHLLMLNYQVEPDLLEPLVPRGTELDLWQDRALVSLVGFRFLKSRLRGWAIPFHQDFAEVNLRLYVRRPTPDGWRRGVVFLREIVAKPAVSWVANAVYEEKYLTTPLSYRVQVPASATDRTGRCEYAWRYGGRRYQMSADFHGLPKPLTPGSEEEFIAEHYWGYTRRSDGSTSEYLVEHRPWKCWSVDAAEFTGDAAAIYGGAFAEVLRQSPSSAFVLDGSEVSVYPGTRLIGEPDLVITSPIPAAACLSSPAPAR
jgi:uncharacterized protein YqjF (DUF2071 family)